MDVSTHRFDHNGQMVPAAQRKNINIPFNSVSDPDSLIPDPDPEFDDKKNDS